MRRDGLILMLIATVALAACSGSAVTTIGPIGSAEPTAPALSPSPSATPSASPSPSASPALHSINDLITAKHPPISSTAVLAAIKIAFNGGNLGVATLASFTNEFTGCRRADPTLKGNPYQIRAIGCQNLIHFLFQQYLKSGDPTCYAAALAVYNYGFNTLSDIQGRNYWAGQVPVYLREVFA